ncbi:ABC-2 type transport system permease protein [Streptacidiphilus sp. MAP12-33]|uniref:ABC transporter permease n=1 Tax=Streptacidiphilus sp. MAP12-33 TaxID=3156266 RepID=UPI0035144402
MTVSQPYSSYPSPQPGVGYAPQPQPMQAPQAPQPHAPQQPFRPAGPGQPSGPRPNILNVIAAEWTKLWTTRATIWLLAGALVAMPAMDLFLTSHYSGNAEVRHDQFLTNSAIGALVAVLLFVPFGTLVITTEYTSGMIRNTLITAPRRFQVLTAKVLVLLLGSLLAGTVLCGISVMAAKALLPGNFADPVPTSQVIQAIFGAGLFLSLCALLSFAIGTLLRRSAPAIVILMALIFLPFVIGIMAGASSGSLGEKLMDYSLFSGLFAQFGNQMSESAPSAGTMLELVGLATVALLGGAYAAFVLRDA